MITARIIHGSHVSGHGAATRASEELQTDYTLKSDRENLLYMPVSVWTCTFYIHVAIFHKSYGFFSFNRIYRKISASHGKIVIEFYFSFAHSFALSNLVCCCHALY